LKESFKAANWRRPRLPSKGGASWRVYIPQLDLLLKPKMAEVLLGTSPRIKALCGCRDTHCCPHGLRDMIERPARHAIYQRAREVERLGAAPQTIRAELYLNENVRRVSDDVARVAAYRGLNEELQQSLRQKQGEMSRFRETVAHLGRGANSASYALVPPRREARKRH
jgi:hypothetical protein